MLLKYQSEFSSHSSSRKYASIVLLQILWAIWSLLNLEVSRSIFPLQLIRIHPLRLLSKISCPSPMKTLLAFSLTSSLMFNGPASARSNSHRSFFSALFLNYNRWWLRVHYGSSMMRNLLSWSPIVHFLRRWGFDYSWRRFWWWEGLRRWLGARILDIHYSFPFLIWNLSRKARRIIMIVKHRLGEISRFREAWESRA